MSKNGPSSFVYGYIDRFDRHGLGFVRIESMDRYLPFTFDKLHNYKGEYPREYGLYVGCLCMVLFERGIEIDCLILQREPVHPWLKRIYRWLRV